GFTYSALSATIGSTRDARRAGRYPATTHTVSMTAAELNLFPPETFNRSVRLVEFSIGRFE
ncbi:MAG: hypothetical protein M3P13_03715, partial [Acidobacteriota bacterium]|nr:hypothetical protein [Acidobacteriota bacterium]